MDLYTCAFVYPPPAFDGPAVDVLHTLCYDAMQEHPVTVNCSDTDAHNYTFLISGAYAHVVAARTFILRNCPLQTRSSIQVPRSEILDLPPNAASPALKQQVRRRLDEIASTTLAHIAVVNPSTPSHPSQSRLPDALYPTNTFLHASPALLNLETDPLCQLVISGSPDIVKVAQVKLLVTLDELAGLHSESIDIDYKLHPIIAGRKRNTIQSIQEETATNIYLPSPLSNLVGDSNPPRRHNPNVIYITGDYFGVQRAKDMLFQLAHSKAGQASSRSLAPILPTKLDWMLTHHMEDLHLIMSDHACFLDFPPLGSQTGIVKVYGESRIGILRSVKAILSLAAQFFIAQFYLLPQHFNLLLPTSALTLNLNSSQISPIVQRLSALIGGAEVVFRDNCFEIFGEESQIRMGIMGIGDLPVVRPFHHEIRFQLELANEHRDFISGKKNGKVNKIMQLTSCKIKFESTTLLSPSSAPTSITPSLSTPTADNSDFSSGFPNRARLYPDHIQENQSLGVGLSGGQHTANPLTSASPTNPMATTSSLPTNFLITLSGTLQQALQGLNALLEEFPAEITFYVPESYHKRIIGVGGRSIQRIMKRWGVFVKFFGNSEAAGPGDANSGPSMGTSSNNAGESDGFADAGTPSPSGFGGIGEDNVIARTPAKNAMNLENLRMTVLELVNPKDKDFTTESVVIPRRYHRTLLGEKNIFIKDIEAKTGSKVRFPDKETASDLVIIYGPESQVHIAAARLLDHVPFEADLTIPFHQDFPRILSSPDFAAFTERIKRDYQVMIVPHIYGVSSQRLSTSTSHASLTQPTKNICSPELTPGDEVQSHTFPPNDIAASLGLVDSSTPPTTATFKFLCQKSNQEFLGAAKEALEGFLRNMNVFFQSSSTNGISGYSTGGSLASRGAGVPNVHSSIGTGPGRVHKRADSFADAFPHFNSKLLSTPNTTEPGTFVSRRIRLASSTPDVKALFNSPATYVYKLPEHDELDDIGFEAPQAPSARAQGNESPWNPPRIRHAPSVSFVNLRNSEDTLKRGSDSLLDAKLSKDNNRPRSLTNRAQSLDLTSLSRSGLANSVRATSPSESTNPSPPTSASAMTLNFPSVGTPGQSPPNMVFPGAGNGSLAAPSSSLLGTHTRSHTQSHTGIAPYITNSQHQHHQHHHSYSHHHSFPSATVNNSNYTHAHTLPSPYEVQPRRSRTQISLSSSSSSLSSNLGQQQARDGNVGVVNQSSVHNVSSNTPILDVSNVLSQLRLDSVN